MGKPKKNMRGIQVVKKSPLLELSSELGTGDAENSAISTKKIKEMKTYILIGGMYRTRFPAIKSTVSKPGLHSRGLRLADSFES